MTTPRYVLVLPVAAALLGLPGAAQAQCGGGGVQGYWCGQPSCGGYGPQDPRCYGRRAYGFQYGDYGWREREQRRDRRDRYEDRRERRDRY